MVEDTVTNDGGTHDVRQTIRSELSSLSATELAELKGQILRQILVKKRDTKLNQSADNAPSSCKRLRNRPRELMCRGWGAFSRDTSAAGQARTRYQSRDPRFDSLSGGEVDKKVFKKHYKFVENEVKPVELVRLHRELSRLERYSDQMQTVLQPDGEDEETNADEVQSRIRQIRYLIRRHNDQQRELHRLENVQRTERANAEDQRSRKINGGRINKKLVKAQQVLSKFESLVTDDCGPDKSPSDSGQHSDTARMSPTAGTAKFDRYMKRKCRKLESRRLKRGDMKL